MRENCVFCQQYLIPGEPEDPASISGYCRRHAHEVMYAEDDSMYYFRIQYQGIIYTVMYVEQHTTAYTSGVHQNPEMWQIYQSGTLDPAILQLPEIPRHITPDNIDEKLPTLLLFS